MIPHTFSTRVTYRRLVGLSFAALVLVSLPGAVTAQSSKPVLTRDHAKTLMAAALTEARRLGAPGGAIAIVDDGGHLLLLERLDNTFPAASRVATAKARTAAVFRRPTSGMEDAVIGGRTTLLNVADAPLSGGVPIMMEGQVVGAMGVSGAASAAQDTEIALAGVDG